MKLLLLFFLMAGSFGLAACQGQKTVVQEKLVTPPVAPASSDQVENGGVDGGGGNGLSGKPLESYQVDLKSVPEFQKFIAPVIRNLKRSFPHLAADMNYLSREREWYFVPVSLRKIPSFKLGTYFATDQIAIQNKSEIWVDAGLYQKMDEEGRARLIMHEMLMGVRILNFTSELEKCFAAAAGADSDAAYREGRKACLKKFKVDSDLGNAFRTEKSVDITEANYALIRKLTNFLLQSDGRVDGQDLENRFAASDFRTYAD